MFFFILIKIERKNYSLVCSFLFFLRLLLCPPTKVIHFGWGVINFQLDLGGVSEMRGEALLNERGTSC